MTRSPDFFRRAPIPSATCLNSRVPRQRTLHRLTTLSPPPPNRLPITMAERNGSPHDTSRMLLENTSGDEGRLPEAKDSDTQTPQPSINRFRMIRDSVPESARLSSSDHTLHEVKTYTTDVVTQSCRENANQQPPLHLLKDLFQADINEVRRITYSFIDLAYSK